jgi:uridine kinase
MFTKSKPYVIGISGPTACGKTYVIEELKKIFDDKILVISQDQYYKDISKLKLERFERANYDIPEAFENNELIKDIKNLLKGKSVTLPQYDFITHTRLKGQVKVKPAEIIIIEGILIFYDPKLRAMMDFKVFLEADPDIRLSRRLIRDIEERGRTVKNLRETIDFYLRTVKPMQEKYVLPLSKYADLVLNTNEGGKKAVGVLEEHIRRILGG